MNSPLEQFRALIPTLPPNVCGIISLYARAARELAIKTVDYQGDALSGELTSYWEEMRSRAEKPMTRHAIHVAAAAVDGWEVVKADEAGTAYNIKFRGAYLPEIHDYATYDDAWNHIVECKAPPYNDSRAAAGALMDRLTDAQYAQCNAVMQLLTGTGHVDGPAKRVKAVLLVLGKWGTDVG